MNDTTATTTGIDPRIITLLLFIADAGGYATLAQLRDTFGAGTLSHALSPAIERELVDVYSNGNSSAYVNVITDKGRALLPTGAATAQPGGPRTTSEGYLEQLRAAFVTFKAAIDAATSDGDARALEAAGDVADHAAALDAVLCAGASLPRVWKATTQPDATAALLGKTVHVLTYEHRHGVNQSAHATVGGTVAEKAEIARTWWDEIRGDADVPDKPPTDDHEAARIYFEHHPSERAYVTTSEITL